MCLASTMYCLVCLSFDHLQNLLQIHANRTVPVHCYSHCAIQPIYRKLTIFSGMPEIREWSQAAIFTKSCACNYPLLNKVQLKCTVEQCTNHLFLRPRIWPENHVDISPKAGTLIPLIFFVFYRSEQSVYRPSIKTSLRAPPIAGGINWYKSYTKVFKRHLETLRHIWNALNMARDGKRTKFWILE